MYGALQAQYMSLSPSCCHVPVQTKVEDAHVLRCLLKDPAIPTDVGH